MMKARQLAEDIGLSLQGTGWAEAFAPILSDTQRLRFSQAREGLLDFSRRLQAQARGESPP